MILGSLPALKDDRRGWDEQQSPVIIDFLEKATQAISYSDDQTWIVFTSDQYGIRHDVQFGTNDGLIAAIYYGTRSQSNLYVLHVYVTTYKGGMYRQAIA